MPDNINVTPGSGATIAADLISSVLHQRVKVEYGADGSATDVDATHPLPVGSGDSDDAAPAGGLMPIAGIYQSTVDEVDAGDVGRLRMSARRGLMTAADYRTLLLTATNPTPTGTDIVNASLAAIVSGDLEVRDTSAHWFFIPLNVSGWRHFALALSQESAFDQAATITVRAGYPSFGPVGLLASFIWPASGSQFTIVEGTNVGQGGTLGGATVASNAVYVIPITLACRYIIISITFSVAPTTGKFRIDIERST
jgi:hypothetical protein